MAEYTLTPKAEEDLRSIWRVVAEDSEAAADRLVRRLLDKLKLASGQPRMGSPRPELSPTARILVEGRYIVIYEPVPEGILAIAIVHGMRDPESWLS